MKVILFTTLLLFSINGFAFNWKKVGEDVEGHSLYVDVDTIKKHNGLVYYWFLTDFLDTVYGKDFIPLRTKISKYEVDCGEEKTTMLNASFYSQSMGKGRIIHELTPNQIQYPKPNTSGYMAMKFACKNAR